MNKLGTLLKKTTPPLQGEGRKQETEEAKKKQEPASAEPVIPRKFSVEEILAMDASAVKASRAGLPAQKKGLLEELGGGKSLEDLGDTIRERLDVLRTELQEDVPTACTVIKDILQMLRAQPKAAEDIILPEDIGLMVSILRKNTGVVAASKVERKGKKDKKAEEAKQVTAAFTAAFGDMSDYV